MHFLRNCWYVAGFPEEIREKPFSRKMLNESVLMYRGSDGRVTAMDNRCPHRMAPLDAGEVKDDIIRCAYHGLRFNREGVCVHLPDGGAAPPRAKLKVYPVLERHGLVWIWMGDPALADATALPDFAYLDSAEFGWWNGYLYAKANFQLLVDNLLDLSHGEFLHPLLASDGWTGRNKQTISQTGDTITLDNIANNDNILPIMAQLRPDMGKIGLSKQTERWDPPSVLKLSVDYYCDEDQIILPSGHFLTPETESTTHYFVRAGQQIDPANEEITEGMRQGVLHIFATEDIPIIEAQQRFIGSVDLMDYNPAILKGDAGSVRVRRLLAKKIRQEREELTSAE